MSNLPRVLSAFAFTAVIAQAQIPMSDFVRTYTYPSQTRGFYFQVPVNFVVTGLLVPNETNQPLQHVALYRTLTDPSLLASVTPIFFLTSAPPNQRIVLTKPEFFQPGEWFGVLGGCGPTTSMDSSYGATTPYPSTVLGKPISLNRMMLQFHLVGSNGIGQIYTNTSNFARVRVFVSGQGEANQYGTAGGALPPSLLVSDPAPPSIGTTGAMVAMPGDPLNLGAVLMLGAATSNIPTPYGTLLNFPPALTIGYPGNIPVTGTLFSLPIPNQNNLLGLSLFFQHGELQGSSFSLGNGISWFLGL